MALKDEKVSVTSGKKKASVRRESSALSSMRVTILHKKTTPKAATLFEPSMTRGRSMSKIRSVSPTPLRDSSWNDGDAGNDFWSISRNIIYRRHVEPRVKLYVPGDESFPNPLKCIDGARSTNTSLDVMLDKNIDGLLKR